MNRFTNLLIICLALLCGWVTARPLAAQTANAIVPVTLANTLAANDDDSTGAVPLNIGGTGGINFFGKSFTHVYVNNNGNLTFGDSLSDFTPNALAQGVTCDSGNACPIIAPFFADVDTTGTGSGLVQYGNATVNGFNAFVANYINVGYFASETDKLNSFQVALIDRSDTGAGNFDIEFNYNSILWETGDDSGGNDGLGGTSAAVGYSNGLTGSSNIYFQLTGSLIPGALINGGPDALISHSLNSSVPGRYILPVRQGAVTLLLSSLTCTPAILGQTGVSGCTVVLTGNAPTGGASVTLSSSNNSLTVPATVAIPAGQNSATFSATSTNTASNRTATVTASFGGSSQPATISLSNAVQTGYIGVFYDSTPPANCPAVLTQLCAANTTVDNDPTLGDGGPLDGPVFIFVNTSGTAITNAVITLVGVAGQYPGDSYNIGTIAANSRVSVVPGISNDGQSHPSNGFFTVTGSINDTSDDFPSLNSTQFKFSGQQGAAQIVSVDVCGVIPAPIFTPACTAAPSNDGQVTSPLINFLGGPGDNDGGCNNCFGPAIVANLGTFSSTTSTAAISITTTSLSSGTVFTAGSQTLTASGGTAPYTWTLVGGSLPPGMGLSSAGVLSGTPTTANSYTFTVKVTDATGAFAVETITLTVAAQSVTITTPSPLPSGMVTVQYPQQVLTASGGNAPYTFSVAANSLPAGLSLSPGGAISGTPTVTGTFTFTLTATDGVNTGTASISIAIRPFSADLMTSAGSLSFALAAGAVALPLGETVQVESTDVTKTLSYSTTITPTEPWLSVSAGGTTPGAFTVSLTSAASSLAASTTPYHTTISVACLSPSPCAGNAQSVGVSLLVSTVSPELTALTNVLSFTTSSTNPQTTTQALGLQNAGGGSITFTSVTCGQPFCMVGAAPASLGAGATGSITVQANPAGLGAGYYFTSVTIVSSAGTITVPVTFLVAGSPSLVLEPSGVQLAMPAGGVAANPDTSFLVNVSGAASPASQVAFTAAVLPGAPWLNLATTSGTSTENTPGVVSYSINQTAAAALTPQAYYGTIRVTSAGAMNSPQDFQVVLNVTAANALQTPNPTPAGLIFISSGSTPAPQIDQVFASSVTAVPYQASAQTTSGGAWLSVSPATGSTSASAPAQSSISVNPAGLASGVYRGSVSYSLAAAAVPTVNVTLLVEGAGASSSQRTAFGPEATAACTPTQLIPTQTALVNDFAAPASWPTPLEIQLNNDCGNAVANGQVVATFSNGDPPLALNPENATSGLYSATWTPRTTGSQVVVTATATATGFAAATTRISGAVAPNVAPTLSPNGTLDAFAIAAEPGVPIAPGSIVQIYGSGLAAQTIVVGTLPLMTNLGGTQVIIGGMAAPLYYVSPGQINAQVPFELTAGQPYEVIVSANGALTTPQTIQSAAVTPGVAAYASGYAIAQHVADSSLITDASPAKPGEYVVIYLAGMGPTTVPVASGAVSPTSPLAYTSDAPTLTLNGEAVSNVLFSGLTPTLAGLYQIDLQIPADAANGDLTLVVNQPGFQGIPVILPVHN